MVSETTSWDYEKFITMLDGQYKTYGNEGAYNNSWSIRPITLTDMYNDCTGGDTPEEKEEEPKQPSVQFLNSSTGTAYIPPLGSWSTTGMPTFLSMTGSGSVSSIINTIADDSADLNN